MISSARVATSPRAAVRLTWWGWALHALVALAAFSAAIADEPATAQPATQLAASTDWRQWRGPSRTSVVENQTWPTALGEANLKQRFRIPLGPSYSGPIVTADRVFVTETVDAQKEVVRALSRTDGSELWRVEWKGALIVPFFAMSNGSWIRATPAYDGSTLYVAGIRDVLVALDGTSGKELWRLDFVSELKTAVPSFGFVSSPLIVGEHLYVQAGSGFCKIEKATGKIVWRTLVDDGGMMGSAFSSPVLATIAGQEQMVVQTRTKLCGVELSEGKELWSLEIPAFRGMNILTPTVIGNTIFTSSYGGKSMLLEVALEGDKWSTKELWTNKTQGYMSSPVVVGDHIYLHLRNQRFTCINIKTGEESFTTKPYGKYWSMIASGKQILALDEKGDLLLVNANPEKFDLIGSQTVSDDETWAHLAIATSSDSSQPGSFDLFIRELEALTLYTWSPK